MIGFTIEEMKRMDNALLWGEKLRNKPVENPIQLERMREEDLLARRMTDADIDMRETSRYLFSGADLVRTDSVGTRPIYNSIMAHEEAFLMFDSQKISTAPTAYSLQVEVTKISGAYGDSRRFVYANKTDTMASMEEVPFPNCCGLCILKDFSIGREMTQDQFNDFFGESIKNISENDFFRKAIIYTWSFGGQHERLISNYPDIEILDKFKNPRTGHIVSGFEISLRNER